MRKLQKVTRLQGCMEIPVSAGAWSLVFIHTPSMKHMQNFCANPKKIFMKYTVNVTLKSARF